jgi:hypothetical protein
MPNSIHEHDEEFGSKREEKESSSAKVGIIGKSA